MVFGVPLVASKLDMQTAFANGAKSALYPWYWKGFCKEYFDDVRYFRHRGPSASLDWQEPSPSPFGATDFRFEEEEKIEDLPFSTGLSAVFVCRKA